MTLTMESMELIASSAASLENWASTMPVAEGAIVCSGYLLKGANEFFLIPFSSTRWRQCHRGWPLQTFPSRKMWLQLCHWVGDYPSLWICGCANPYPNKIINTLYHLQKQELFSNHQINVWRRLPFELLGLHTTMKPSCPPSSNSAKSLYSTTKWELQHFFTNLISSLLFPRTSRFNFAIYLRRIASASLTQTLGSKRESPKVMGMHAYPQ